VVIKYIKISSLYFVLHQSKF